MRTVVVPTIFRNGEGNLIRVDESWYEYDELSLNQGFGIEHAHSISGEDAQDGHVWVQVTRFHLDGYALASDVSIEEYARWEADLANTKRDDEIKRRLQEEDDRKEQEENLAKAKDSAEKKLKELGITKEELRAALFS